MICGAKPHPTLASMCQISNYLSASSAGANKYYLGTIVDGAKGMVHISK
jgi:hypothetical protein